MPKRATKGSAGYDICIPFDVVLAPHTSVKVPTGVRITDMPRSVFMAVYVRSSVGIKRNVVLCNNVGIIDSDFNKDIWLALRNEGDEDVEFLAGERVAQGIIQPYLVCDDDDAVGNRDGGIGSTGTGA